MKQLTKIIILLCIILSACSSNDEVSIARKMPLSKIKNSTDFYWFEYEYKQYVIDTNIINNISGVPISYDDFRFVLFVESDCLCGVGYTQFPQFIKLLDAAGVAEQYYDIYLMENINSSHPYSAQYKVKTLPSIILTNNGQYLYSITDSMAVYGTSLEKEVVNAFTLITNISQDQ